MFDSWNELFVVISCVWFCQIWHGAWWPIISSLVSKNKVLALLWFFRCTLVNIRHTTIFFLERKSFFFITLPWRPHLFIPFLLCCHEDKKLKCYRGLLVTWCSSWGFFMSIKWPDLGLTLPGRSLLGRVINSPSDCRMVNFKLFQDGLITLHRLESSNNCISEVMVDGDDIHVSAPEHLSPKRLLFKKSKLLPCFASFSHLVFEYWFTFCICCQLVICLFIEVDEDHTDDKNELRESVLSFSHDCIYK